MDVSTDESSAVVTSDGLLYRFGDCRWTVPNALPLDVNERQHGHGARAYLEAAGPANGNSAEALVTGVLVWPTLMLPLLPEPHAGEVDDGGASDAPPSLGVCWGAAPVFLAPPAGAVLPPLPVFQAIEQGKPPAVPHFPSAHMMMHQHQRPGFGGAPGRPGAPGARPMMHHFPPPPVQPIYRPPQYIPREYSREEEMGTQGGFCYWAAPGRRIRAPGGTGAARVNLQARITSVIIESFAMWATDAEGRLYCAAAWQQAGQTRYLEDLPHRFLTPVAGFGPPPRGAANSAVSGTGRVAVAVFHGRQGQGVNIVAARHESPVTAAPVVCADLSVRSPLADAWRAKGAGAPAAAGVGLSGAGGVAASPGDAAAAAVRSSPPQPPGRIVYDIMVAGPKVAAGFAFALEEDMSMPRDHKLAMARGVTLPVALPALSGLPAPPSDLSYGCGMGGAAGMITGSPATEGRVAAMMATAAAALNAMHRAAVPTSAETAVAAAGSTVGAAGLLPPPVPAAAPVLDTTGSLVLASPAIQLLAIPPIARPNQPMAVQWRAPANLAGGPNSILIFAASGGQPLLKVQPITLRNGAVAFAAPSAPGRYVAVLSLGACIQDLPTWAGRVTATFAVSLRAPLLRGLSFGSIGSASGSSRSAPSAAADLFSSNRKPGFPALAPREASSVLIRALSPFLPLSALPYLAVGTRSLHRALPWSGADVIALLPAEDAAGLQADTGADADADAIPTLHGSSALVAGSHAALSAADSALAGATGAAALLPRPVPPVGSAAWWWSRPLPVTGVTSSSHGQAAPRIAVFSTQPRLLDSDAMAARAQAAIAARAAGAAAGGAGAGSMSGRATSAPGADAAGLDGSEAAGGELSFSVGAAGAAKASSMGSGLSAVDAAATLLSRDAEAPEHEQLWMCGPTRDVAPGPYVLAWVGLSAASIGTRSAALRHSLAPVSYPADALTPADPAATRALTNGSGAAALSTTAGVDGSVLARNGCNDGSDAYSIPAHLAKAAQEAGAVVWAHDCSLTASAGAGAPAAPQGDTTTQADDGDSPAAAGGADDGASGTAGAAASLAASLNIVHAAPGGSVVVRVHVTTAGRPVSPRDVLVWADRRDVDARLRSASALAAGELAGFGAAYEHMHRVFQKHAADAVGRARLAFAHSDILSDAEATAAAAAAAGDASGSAAAASSAAAAAAPGGASAAAAAIKIARARAALAVVTAASKITRSANATSANSPFIRAASLAEAMAAAASEEAPGAAAGTGGSASCEVTLTAPSIPGDYVLLLLLEDHLHVAGPALGGAGDAAAAAPPLRLAAQSGRVCVLITKIPLSERMAAKRAEREAHKEAIAGRLTERALERRAKASEAVAAARERGQAALVAARARAAERAETLRLRALERGGPAAAAAINAAYARDPAAAANAAAAARAAVGAAAPAAARAAGPAGPAAAPADPDNDDDGEFSDGEDDCYDDEEPQDFLDPGSNVK